MFDFFERLISRVVISIYADDGPLPLQYRTNESGVASLDEILEKEYFGLELPKPKAEETKDLPDIDNLVQLFKREENGQANNTKSRVSLLLPFFAQHLTDAVFQSKEGYKTDAPHEIVLNQIYGSNACDTKILRLKTGGRLKSQTVKYNHGYEEFPPRLMEKINGNWQIKDEFKDLAYFKGCTNTECEKRDSLLEKYKGREEYICATALFQGNTTLGNFAITTLLLREHNRLCAEIEKEADIACIKDEEEKDETIFNLVRQNMIVAYMKIVLEDYINSIAGINRIKMDTKSFFYEKKRWCRATPIPFHFNILYRIHCMIPNYLVGYKEKGFDIFRSSNDFVFEHGLAKIFELASSQPAEKICLGNTHQELLNIDKAMLIKGRKMLASFNAHRESHKQGSSITFEDLDPKYQEQLRKLYNNDPDKIDYAVGLYAQLPRSTKWYIRFLEYIGAKGKPIFSKTLMDGIARHAFRHILSNPYLTKEYLNEQSMTKTGWKNLQNTHSVADLVKRNVKNEISQKEIEKLHISFDMNS